jgi:hypothetical protein
MNSQLDSDMEIAVEVLEAVDREIANILLLTQHGSPEKAAFFAQKLAARRAQREQLRARFIAAAELLQQRANRSPGEPLCNDLEYDA